MKLRIFIDQKRRDWARKKKLMKRKAFFLKAKIFLICVLPVIIILLAVKVIQTLVRTKLRKAAGAAENEIRSSKKPVAQTTEKPEFVTPEPVGTVTASH